MDLRVAKFFHGYATDFDAIYGTGGGVVKALVNRLFRKSMKLRFVKTLECCQPVQGKSVLDIGCGPGHYSVALAKMGAESVLGIDFAEGMLEIASRRAQLEGVSQICRFDRADFFTHTFTHPFDYVVVMGFMDYVQEAEAAVRRILELTRGRAFLSFPAAVGFLARQRKLRYRNRCPLYFYTEPQIKELFPNVKGVDVLIQPIHRDFFVTVSK